MVACTNSNGGFGVWRGGCDDASCNGNDSYGLGSIPSVTVHGAILVATYTSSVGAKVGGGTNCCARGDNNHS